MLHIVLGKTGSGKSSWCLEKVRALAEQGTASILVVPEQMVYTFEKATVERMPGALASFAEVKSCKRLCSNILEGSAAAARTRLDPAQKTVIIRQAVLKCRNALEYYKKRCSDPSFYEMLCSLFDELRNAGATSSKLAAVAAECGNSLSGMKFSEIAAVLEQYEQLLDKGAFDDAGELTAAASMTADSAVLRNRHVFFDGFTGFTHAEIVFLRSVLKAADEVTVTLACEGNERELDEATGVCYKTYMKLKELAFEETGYPADVIRLPAEGRSGATGLKAASDYFCSGRITEEKCEGVGLLSGSDRYDESAAVAEEIMRLVREEGFRFSDIGVSIRDAEGYRYALCRTMDRFGIPYHFDVSDTLECSAAAIFLDCAFEMAGGVRTSPLLRMLKCGVCDITDEETSLLENYSFVHSVDRSGWESPFALNPSGFGAPAGHDLEVLEKTENARIKVMAWMDGYVRRAPGLRGRKLLREAYDLMERSGAVDGIVKDNAEGRRNAALAFQMIDRFYRLLGDEEVSREEMRSMLKLLASATQASTIPSSLDCVMICDAARSAPFNPRANFVMGLNDGVFPRDDFSGLIFTLEERDLLLENEIRLAGCFEECCDMEAFYLYRAVCAPTERLYLSWAENEGAEKMLRSAELDGFASAYRLTVPERKREAGIVNRETARDAFAGAMSDMDTELMEALRRSTESEEIRKLEEAVTRKEFRINDRDAARNLTGETMLLSASRIEEFETCRFKYFMNYMLGIKPMQKAELSAIEVGSFVHDVMEKLLKEFDGDLAEADEEQIGEACGRLADEYAADRIGSIVKEARNSSLIDQIKAGTVRLAMRVREEQMQSEFRVADCELYIGTKGEIKPVEYILPDGSKAVVEGKIDRVDTFVSADRVYVRVVDYKTGTKDFKLSDVLQGMNLQMLLYLFALCRNGSGRYGGKVAPAGVLYLPADPPAKSDRAEAERAFRMDGVLLDDPEVLEAMEKDGNGVFIAPQKGKDNWKYGCRLSGDLFGKLEKKIDAIVSGMAVSLREGDIAAQPVADEKEEPLPCAYCGYAAVCGRDRVSSYRVLKKIEAKAVLEEED